MQKKISTNTIERLILYRKIINELINDGIYNIYSHRLSNLAENTPAQVRRDLMVIGYTGSPAHGYILKELEESISDFLDSNDGQNACIVGLGNLGRAILDYCKNRNSKINILATFDIDPNKIDRDFNGCHCYNIDDLESKVEDYRIEVAILTIPSAEEAQIVAERLVQSGIRGILNYTSARLKLSPSVYVEYRDMMMALEKVSYFAKTNR